MKKTFALKKPILIITCLVLSAVFFACGAPKRDEFGNVPITSNWKLVSITTNGTKTDYKNENPIIKIFVSGASPKFKCDGSSCTLTIGKRAHNGTITGQAGEYVIDYSDSYKDMTATVSADRLYLRDMDGKIEIVFEAK
ncbi:MAG: hypothetical protein IKO32_11085 [Lachnospiraceae bacterium]|nr:hypothetical protein [Lachnospiraceae bacterium]